MAPTTRMALGGALALLLGALAWMLWDRSAAPVGAADPMPEAHVARVVEPATAGVAAAGQADLDRVSLPEIGPADTTLLHPFAYELEVQVVDRLGLPVRGARVLLAPRGCRLDEVPERTDGDGLVRVQWSGRVGSMPMVVATRSDETRDATRRLTVFSGTTTRVVFGGSGRQRGVFHLVSGGGSQGIQLSFEGLQPEFARSLSLALEGIVVQQGSFGDNPRLRAGLHPFATFGDLQWTKRGGEAGQTFQVAGVQGMTFTISGADIQVGSASTEAPPPARIEGTVYGEDGKPCPSCPVSWGTAVDRPSGRTETDAAGAFRFDDVPVGALELRAGGGDGGLQHLTVGTLSGQTSNVDVQLRREARVTGRAVAVDGASTAGWRVEWVGAQLPWYDACEVADGGRFVLPNLPAGGAGQLLLWRGGEPSALPVAQLANVRPDSGDVELRFDPALGAGSLQLEPLLPDGVDKAAVEVRVFQEDTGRGAALRKREDSNQFAVAGLAAGWYRLELGGPGLGWLDAGRHFVDGRSCVDLGRVALPGTGTVRLQLPPGAGAVPADADGGVGLEIYLRRDDCDVRIEDVGLAGDELLRLPPGDYFAIWRAASGTSRFTPFHVESGREVEVRCANTDAPAQPAGAVAPDGERR